MTGRQNAAPDLRWPVTSEDVLKIARQAARRGPHPTPEQCENMAKVLSGGASVRIENGVGRFMTEDEAYPDNRLARKKVRDAINLLMRACEREIPPNSTRKKPKPGVLRRSLLAPGNTPYLTGNFHPLVRLHKALHDSEAHLLPELFRLDDLIYEIHDAAQDMFEACGRKRTKATRNSVVAIFIELALVRLGFNGSVRRRMEREAIAKILATRRRQ